MKKIGFFLLMSLFLSNTVFATSTYHLACRDTGLRVSEKGEVSKTKNPRNTLVEIYLTPKRKVYLISNSVFTSTGQNIQQYTYAGNVDFFDKGTVESYVNSLLHVYFSEDHKTLIKEMIGSYFIYNCEDY